MINILMVCLGNICRSPMAEGILRHHAQRMGLPINVDSAGTGGWHAGEPPDRRAIRTARKNGVDISGLRARKFSTDDFDRFDRIFVMDRSNLSDVLSVARNENDLSKVDLFLHQLQPGSGAEVPDPWFGDEDGFIPVYELLENATLAFLEKLKNEQAHP
jgi:protein-tyrosine phosphatase